MSEAIQQDQQGRPPRPGRTPAALATALKVAGGIVAGTGLALALACAITGLADSNQGRFLAGLAFLLGAVAGGAGLWAGGWLVEYVARARAELREGLRRLEKRAPAAAPAPPPVMPVEPSAPVPAAPPAAWQAVLELLEQLRADVLLTDEQRRQKLLRMAKGRIAEIVAQFAEDLADGRLETAEQRIEDLIGQPGSEEAVGQLRGQLLAGLVRRGEEAIAGGELEAARGCIERIRRQDPSHEQLAVLRERVLVFFSERADRAILSGDFRRAEDWIEELAEAGPDDLRVVERRARLQQARAAVMASEFTKQKRAVEDLLAVADYDRAEAAAEDLMVRLGVTDEVKAFVDLVRREAAAFRDEQRRRMLEEIRQYGEARQWRKALDAGREMLAEHPRSRQGEEVRAMMLRLEENARIEEVRELRDRIADLIERKRFAEAVEVAEDVIHRFPDTQAAGQLSREIDKLRKRAGMGEAT